MLVGNGLRLLDDLGGGSGTDREELGLRPKERAALRLVSAVDGGVQDNHCRRNSFLVLAISLPLCRIGDPCATDWRKGDALAYGVSKHIDGSEECDGETSASSHFGGV